MYKVMILVTLLLRSFVLVAIYLRPDRKLFTLVELRYDLLAA